MTLREFANAVDGFFELEDERNENLLYSARLISFYASAPHLSKKSGIKKPADLWSMKVDEREQKAKIERLKKRKPIEKIENYKW